VVSNDATLCLTVVVPTDHNIVLCTMLATSWLQPTHRARLQTFGDCSNL